MGLGDMYRPSFVAVKTRFRISTAIVKTDLSNFYNPSTGFVVQTSTELQRVLQLSKRAFNRICSSKLQKAVNFFFTEILDSAIINMCSTILHKVFNGRPDSQTILYTIWSSKYGLFTGSVEVKTGSPKNVSPTVFFRSWTDFLTAKLSCQTFTVLRQAFGGQNGFVQPPTVFSAVAKVRTSEGSNFWWSKTWSGLQTLE